MGVALMSAVSKQVLRKPLPEAMSEILGTDAKGVQKLKEIVKQAEILDK